MAEQSYTDLANLVFLTPENACFSRNANGFVCLRAFLPPETDDLTAETLPPEWRDLGRVQFHRAFPFDAPDEFLSVQDASGKEYGIIRALADFDGQTRELIAADLERKYYAPTILRIRSLKEKLGFSYWETDTDHGKRNFTMQDTYRNLIRNSEHGIILTDVDGNRYAIPNVLELDAKSFRKIELYL